jgi:hypothetical protein
MIPRRVSTKTVFAVPIFRETASETNGRPGILAVLVTEPRTFDPLTAFGRARPPTPERRFGAITYGTRETPLVTIQR